MPPIPRTPAAKKPAKRAGRRRAQEADIRNIVDPVSTETPQGENPATEPRPIPEDEPLNTEVFSEVPKARSGSLESRLAQAFASTSMIPAFVGDGYSAFIIASRSARFAHDLAELAKVNPRVKKILEGLLDGGTYGGVIFSGAALALPIAWGYGILPAPPMDPFAAFYPQLPAGVVPRSAREARRAPAMPASGPTPQGNVRGPGGGAPGPASVSARPGGDGESPPGVVTVKPGAVPPMNPAAI